MQNVYFIGIGGIGMSALARYLTSAGVMVSGYDKTSTPLTQSLEREGLSIHYSDSPELINHEIDLVVYTPAIPSDLKELQKAIELKLPLLKRSELLEIITRDHQTLAVAGTHGKTTVSTMLAHIIYPSPQGCTAFLGGIANNYNTNLLLNPEAEFMVAEADEFDRSFLKLYPKVAVITSTDADHLDIYQNHNNLLQSFAAFTANINNNGFLIIKKGIKLPGEQSNQYKTYTYAATEDADFCIKDLNLKDGRYTFTLKTPEGEIDQIQPVFPGFFNVENSIAAAAAAWVCGIEPDLIRKGINTFAGVKRRFDHRIIQPGFLYIDDYAHHPEELKACITSVRALYPERKITGIFQPHLYTRTRDFAQGFAESLSLLDELVLLDIYPAREKPIDGISSSMLLDLITIDLKTVKSKEQTINWLRNYKPDILLTLGAGDIDQLVPEIEKIFN